MAGSVVVRSNRIAECKRLFAGAVRDARHKAALDCQALSRQNIVSMGAVDTGNLLNSQEAVPEAGDGTSETRSNAEYSGFVHDGTRFMAARPFLRLAADAVLPGYVAAMGDVERRLR